MGTVQKLAEEVKQGLSTALPTLRKTVINKRSRAVGAMLDAQPPQPTALANVLPLPTDRQDRREQGLRRLLKTPRIASPALLAPVARAEWAAAAWNGPTVILSLDQPA